MKYSILGVLCVLAVKKIEEVVSGMSNSIGLMCYSYVGNKESGIKIINKLKGVALWTNTH